MQAETGIGGNVGTSTNLIRVGQKLGVLGCEEPKPGRPNTLRWWHVLRPGTYGTPDLITKMTYGRALCGRVVVSNGYAADWRPAEGSMCPACNEQL